MCTPPMLTIGVHTAALDGGDHIVSRCLLPWLTDGTLLVDVVTGAAFSAHSLSFVVLAACTC
jgi:hypothetical protein